MVESSVSASTSLFSSIKEKSSEVELQTRALQVSVMAKAVASRVGDD